MTAALSFPGGSIDTSSMPAEPSGISTRQCVVCLAIRPEHSTEYCDGCQARVEALVQGDASAMFSNRPDIDRVITARATVITLLQDARCHLDEAQAGPDVFAREWAVGKLIETVKAIHLVRSAVR